MTRVAMSELGESLGDYLRDQRCAARLTLRQLAERAEVSNPYLSQVERGLRRPSAQVLSQIAHGLQISAEALYVRAGLLEAAAPERASGPEDPEGAVSAAVRSDPHLRERHRQILLDLYATLRREAAADAAGAVSATVSATGAAAAAVRAAVARAAVSVDPRAGVDRSDLAAAEPTGAARAATDSTSTSHLGVEPTGVEPTGADGTVTHRTAPSRSATIRTAPEQGVADRTGTDRTHEHRTTPARPGSATTGDHRAAPSTGRTA